MSEFFHSGDLSGFNLFPSSLFSHKYFALSKDDPGLLFFYIWSQNTVFERLGPDRNIYLQKNVFFYIPFSYAKILGETKFQLQKFPEVGEKQ